MTAAQIKYRNSPKGKATYSRMSALRYARYKKIVFDHYGPICAKCGFDDVRALSLDHVHGGGNAHRKLVGKGRAQWRFVALQGFPKDFQILCMNCQFIKRHENNEAPKVILP